MTEQQTELVMHGLPSKRELDAACRAQIAGLRRHWRLVSGAKSGSAIGTDAAPISLLERLHRQLDKRLFGRGPWKVEPWRDDLQAWDGSPSIEEQWHLAWCREAAAGLDVECLCVEFEGLPMAQLEGAVRSRLGQRGGTVCARVWRLHGTRAPTLLFVGSLRINHRSLHRSVGMCAAKVSALLKGACVRWGRSSIPVDACSAQAPTPLAPIAQLLQLVRSVLTRLMWRDQWRIEVGTLHGVESGEAETAIVFRPPDSAFWADPFLLRRGQRTWVLFEELPFATGRGHIAAIEVDASGRPLAPPRVVLQEPWHLSYPFVWCEGERVYMIPESGESRELMLYEAVGDGMEWQRSAVLMTGQRLADATVARVGQRLWMFATCADEGIASMEDVLHIYWADQIAGPWHPHMLNPVKIDATSSRPAGSMRVIDGVLHRVVMDCSSTYGGSVRCMRVLRLTEDEFDEVPVSGWLPNRETQAEPWHTFNSIGHMMVTDRQVRRPRWRT